MLYSPQPLHIPDGFLSPLVAAIGWALAVLVIALAIRLTRRQLGERQVPLMGVLAAFIFAAQAINFPVAAGTSGHLIGGTLAAVLVGPWAGTLIMTAVVAVQGLLFQDGGLLVMGWNILNMGVFSVFAGYAAYNLMRRLAGDHLAARLAGVFLGAWISVEIGAMATAFELAASGTSPLTLALPAMVGVHALIGLGEALISTAAVGFVLRSRPAVLETVETSPGRKTASLMAGGLLVALVIALLSPLASASPDGLEFVAEQQGFGIRSLEPPFTILEDYGVPFITNPVIATMVAVAVGTLVVSGVAYLVGKSTARRSSSGA
ncbi:MAG: energy-coupling factor ABC transporter permease [Anaerolineales bacterium]|jgi:cobalt/nickel transport system permease protein